MKKLFLSSFCLLGILNLDAQRYYYSSYSSTTTYDNSGFYAWSATNNAVNTAGNLVSDLISEKKRAREAEERKVAEAAHKVKMQAKVKQIKDYYTELGNYPETVKDGWHSATIIGGDDYISDRKVFVQNNKIQKIVLDNWYEQELVMSGPIKKGKTGIQIKDGKGPEMGLLDVYLINAISDPTSNATPPLRPGVVTFWTNYKHFKDVQLTFEDANLGNMQHRYSFSQPPACGSDTEFTIVYKPGVYNYKATLKSRNNKYLCEGKAVITEGGCINIQLNDAKHISKD